MKLLTGFNWLGIRSSVSAILNVLHKQGNFSTDELLADLKGLCSMPVVTPVDWYCGHLYVRDTVLIKTFMVVVTNDRKRVERKLLHFHFIYRKFHGVFLFLIPPMNAHKCLLQLL